MRQSFKILALVIGLSTASGMVRAELPLTEVLLADLGLSPAEIAEIKAGKIVPRSAASANERDLATAFAFFVPVTPAELVKQLRSGLLQNVDPNTISRGTISPAGSLEDFKALSLTPDGVRRAKHYATAESDGDLNLSADELAAFNKIGSAASVSDVEAQIRSALLARYQAYHTKGLAGIAPYLRGSDAPRSAGDDLKAAFGSLKNLQKFAPAAYAGMLGYPSSQPPGTGEVFNWSQLTAHDIPTIVLTQGLFVPDGDAFLVLQRQFYVSEGFNAEQAVAGVFPTQGGAVVVYANHTSTDQVAGFGGGAKRSIGSKLMSSELQGIFGKLQKAAR